VFSVADSEHVDVQCLEFTRHSNCVVHGSGNPLDDYTSNGICTTVTSK
jgi:hypothetical protein